MKNNNLTEALTECIIACQKCANACLNEENVKKMARCIKTDLDCAAICNVTLELAIRDSDILDKQLEVCAEICRICAEECEMHAKNGMQHCKECAEACRRCEEACQQVA